MIVPPEIEMQPDAPGEPVDEINGSINLYEILGVTPDADLKTIRKRIGVLFLEAQNNVDHRSFRRRFYYRELTEVVLPRARHILLDAERREDYNLSLGVAAPSDFSVSSSNSPLSSPTAPIEYSNTASARPTSSAPSIDDLAVFNGQASNGRAAMPPNSETAFGASNTNNAAAEANIAARGVTPDHLKMDAERVERRRDFKRRELIKHELVAQGTRWAIMVGISTFALAALLLLGAGATLHVQALRLAAVPIALVCAAFCAHSAHRQARKSIIALLSKMPYEQLLQRCAKM
jgi:hypothetical protein